MYKLSAHITYYIGESTLIIETKSMVQNLKETAQKNIIPSQVNSSDWS